MDSFSSASDVLKYLLEPSPLFPYVFLGIPIYFIGCYMVYLYEGERQKFSYEEAKNTFWNSMLLGVMCKSSFD